MRKVRLGMPIMDEEFVDVNQDDSDSETPATAAANTNKDAQQVLQLCLVLSGEGCMIVNNPRKDNSQTARV